MVALVAVLLFTANYGGLEHAWDEYQAKQISFQNTTDTALCFGDGGPMSSECGREIKPHDNSDWSLEACTDGELVTVYNPQTQAELYRRSTACGGFDGATIIINQRDGQFVVADDLQPLATAGAQAGAR